MAENLAEVAEQFLGKIMETRAHVHNQSPPRPRFIIKVAFAQGLNTSPQSVSPLPTTLPILFSLAAFPLSSCEREFFANLGREGVCVCEYWLAHRGKTLKRVMPPRHVRVSGENMD